MLEWPVRSLVEPAIVQFEFALQEGAFSVFHFQRVEISSDQEQTAFTRIDMRMRTIEHVLIDDH